MKSLDDARSMREQDPEDMLGMVAGLQSQLARAGEARAAFRATCPELAARQEIASVRAGGSNRRVLQVLVCGMGGSAIGADFASAWAEAMGFRIRISVHRSYGLPAWWDSETLLLFSSYSGNTEETLSAYRSARGGATRASGSNPARLCITTGGTLAALARADGVPVFDLPPGLKPRAALGHSFVALLVLLNETGFIATDPVPELEAASHDLAALAARCAPEVPETENPAKRLARSWYGCFPFFYSGPGLTRPVGVRWKGQVHENAKALAATSTFPELDHNEIMAWGALPEVRRLCRLVFLRDRDDSSRVEAGMRETASIVGPHVAGIDWVDTAGATVLERLLGAALLGDFASVYLAFLNGADPSPMPEIDLLKQRLAAQA